MILKGSGTLYAHTDTDIGRDEIKTDGQQNYERHFAMDGESSSLDSIYTLKKIEDKKNVISSKTKTANNTSQNISQQDTTPSEKAAKSSRVLKTKTPWWVGMGLNTSSPTWYNYYMIALDGPRGANQFARTYGNDSIKSNSKIRQNTKGIATGFSVGSLQDTSQRE